MSREQVFGVKLTPQELGAAVDEFDKNGDGLISCKEFIQSFLKLGKYDPGNLRPCRGMHFEHMFWESHHVKYLFYA